MLFLSVAEVVDIALPRIDPVTNRDCRATRDFLFTSLSTTLSLLFRGRLLAIPKDFLCPSAVLAPLWLADPGGGVGSGSPRPEAAKAELEGSNTLSVVLEL